MHFRRQLVPALVLATAGVAQTSSTSTPPASVPSAPPATAPAAVTSPPTVTAPTTAVTPSLRPVIPPVGNTPNPPPAVNPLAPVPPASAVSTAAQSVVNGVVLPGGPDAAAQVALANDPNNINALAALGVDAALNPSAALATLRAAPATNQQAVLRSLQTRVDATTRALVDLRAQARANGVTGAGANYDQAAENIRLREAALREAIQSAGSAADEAGWVQARSQVETQYQAYVDAVMRARALLQSPTQSP